MKVFRRAVVAILAVAVLTTATCVVISNLNKPSETEQSAVETKETPPDPKITQFDAKYLFVGTTFWGRNTNKSARASELGVKYPFSQLNTLGRENYQAWIGGLECPVTDAGHNYNEEDKIFKFNCDPDYLPEAAKYFTAFLLGNNHAGNQGLEGMRTTRKYLDQNGIQYFGTPKRTAADTRDTEYRNDEADISNCAIVVLPVKATYDNKEVKDLSFPFGFCSAHGVYGVPGEDFQQNIKNYAAVVPTIAMPHMGVEYQKSHDQLRQNLYRKLIDYGAESVIADHPHTVQDSEAYKGKLQKCHAVPPSKVMSLFPLAVQTSKNGTILAKNVSRIKRHASIKSQRLSSRNQPSNGTITTTPQLAQGTASRASQATQTRLQSANVSTGQTLPPVLQNKK